MRNSSRLWWLHGAILFAAVVGCNRNCTNNGGSCGPAGSGASPYGASSIGGPVGSAGASIYSQGASQGFPSSTSYPGAASSMSNSSAFPSSANAGYMPGMSSMPTGLGSTK